MDDEIFHLPDIDRVCIFHIPKNAGTSLVTAVRNCYPHNYVRAKRGFSSHEALLEDLTDPDYGDKLGHIRNPASGLTGTELVIGHLNYGIHRLLGGRTLYVAFLREPVSRLQSLYQNYRRSRPNRLTVDGKLLSFVDFYAHLSNQERVDVYNEQAKILTGRFLHDDPTCMVSSPPGLSDEATSNVESSIFFTGLYERFDESIELLKALLGLPRLQVGHHNQGGYSFDRTGLAMADRKVVLRLNVPDPAAYLAAKSRFDRLSEYVRSLADRDALAERVGDWIRETEGTNPVPPMPIPASRPLDRAAAEVSGGTLDREHPTAEH